MNWEAMGAIGEVAGAVAVVVTLLYLAQQTRVNTKAVAGSSSREVWLALSEWNREIARDENLNRIGIKSLQPEMQEYTADEWHNFMAYSSAYFSILEADWVNHDLNVGYHGVRLYEKAGFIHSCPAWRRAWDEWKEGGAVDAGLIEAIEATEHRFADLVSPRNAD